MKLLSRKRQARERPEQSGYTLALAFFYSFFLHAAVVAVILLLHFLVIPKAVLLPSYQVKLVGPPKESAPAPAAASVPPKKEAMPETAKPSPKLKKAVVEVKKAAPKKASMPDLTRQKKTPAPSEQTKSHEATPQKSPAGPSVPVEGPATTGKKIESVGVTTQQDFKDSAYLAIVIEHIKRNWNPPMDVKDAKARIIFKVDRSGRVVAVQRDDEHSNASFAFKQAAERAIYASNPFPRLPDDYFKQSLEFTVDLAPED
jgi:outer membrane biosynthesis protein TonB